MLTPADRLRSLVKEATHGRTWRLDEYENWIVTDGERQVAYCGPQPPDSNPVFSENHAHLIALAPQLALLVARMAEALRETIATVIWMSGSGDFAPGAEGHDEWVRCREKLYEAMELERSLAALFPEDSA